MDAADGDIVFHYSKTEQAIVSFSVVRGEAWEAETIWSARGTSARSKGLQPYPRPGYWRGLQHTSELASPVSLDIIRSRRDEVLAIPKRLEDLHNPPTYFPFHSYTATSLRPMEGYLFKLPSAFLKLFKLPEVPADPIAGSDRPPAISPDVVATPLAGGLPYEFADEEVAVSKSQPMSVDPALMERALKSHRATQNALAHKLLEVGLTPLRPAPGDPDWDLGWTHRSEFYVVEVKSITTHNEERQLRLAVGQVLRYRQAISSRDGGTVVPIIALGCEPLDGTWLELCQSLGVLLTWPPDWPRLDPLLS
jgi:hypothetical protein